MKQYVLKFKTVSDMKAFYKDVRGKEFKKGVPGYSARTAILTLTPSEARAAKRYAYCVEEQP